MITGPSPNRGFVRWRVLLLGALVLGPWSLVIPRGVGQELVVSRDGKVLRNARIEHVDPDGITYRHNEGDTKLPFEDLPESVRRTHNFDPKRAADFRREQAEKAEAERRWIAENEVRHREALAKRARELAAAATTAPTTTKTENGFTYAPGTGPGSGDATARAAAANVAAQMAKWAAVQERLADRSLLNHPLWVKSPIGSVKNIIERRPGEFGNGESSFFTPNYEKREFADLYDERLLSWW